VTKTCRRWCGPPNSAFASGYWTSKVRVRRLATMRGDAVTRGLIGLSATLLVLSACSGDSGAEDSTSTSTAAPATTASDQSADPTSRLLDAGSEPRVELRIEGDAGSTISVDATYRSETTVDGVTSQDVRSGSFDLASTLSANGNVVSLELDPTVGTLTGVAEPEEVGSEVWRLDALGNLAESERSETRSDIDPDLVDLLSLPGLVLPVPSEPVGVGAMWSFLFDGGERLGIVTVESMTETEVVISIEAAREVDGDSVTLTGAGTYDRASLLAMDAVFETAIEYEVDVTANGVPTTLTGIRIATRAYRQVDG
jgi:hypothetical protein